MKVPSLKESVDWLASAVTGVGVLAVTNRRWSPALLASALGMGLFVGVAFGPASDGLNALTSQVVAVEGSTEEEPVVEAAAGGGGSVSTAGGSGGGGTSATVTPTTTPTALPPVTPTPVTEPLPVDDVDEDASDDIDDTDDTDETDEEETEGFLVDGTVVAVNPVAQSYSLAVPGEQLYVVHAKKLPAAGDQVEVSLIRLANGTNGEEDGRKLTGSAKSAEVAGFVSYVSPVGETPTYAVSSPGASLPIVFQASEAALDLPKLGEFVTVDVTIGEPPEEETDEPEETEPPAGECVRTEPLEAVEPEAELVEKERESDGLEPVTFFDMAGTVQAICPDTSQLLLSADSTRQSGVDVTIDVPDDIELSKLDVDAAVLALVEVAEDGSLTLAGIASDDGEKGADDDKQLQGDFG